MGSYHPSDTHTNSQSKLEHCIKEILTYIKPTADDTVKRQHVINELVRAIQTDQSLIDAGASVKAFGSFVSNLYTRWGDLDISIDLTQSISSPAARRRKLNVLQKIMWALQRTGVAYNIEFVRHARVPLVVYQSKYYNISCDISIDNYSGYLKSLVLRLISGIDERFRDFILLIKEWAKAQNVNDPKAGTLNSYSLSLLIIFHFQTCTPAIFPPLRDLYEGSIVDDIKGFSTSERIESLFSAKIARYRSQLFSQRNRSSISQILISFFDKFSQLDVLASNFVISTYTGQWKPISSNNRLMCKSQQLFIEDPFEHAENASRAVSFSGLRMITQAFMDTYRKLSSQSMLMDRTSLLNVLVVPEIGLNLEPGRKTHAYGRTIQQWSNAASPASSQVRFGARLHGSPQSTSTSSEAEREINEKVRKWIL